MENQRPSKQAEKPILDHDLQAVSKFWNAHLCGKHFIDASYPSLAFFDQYTAFRYKKTHHLLTYINWEGAQEKDVLEVGLGIGADAVKWATHAKSYLGIDLTPEAVEATQTHLNLRHLKGKTQLGNAEKLDFSNAQFDLVYSHGVLHHTPDIQASFGEINRVLKDQGEFIVMLYAKGSFNYWFRIQLYFRLRLLFEILKNKMGGQSKGNWKLHYLNFKKQGWNYLSWKEFPHHCTDGPDCTIANIYSKKAVKTMLTQAGFTVKKMKKAHFPLGGRFPKLEQFIGSILGFHLITWAKKN